VKLNEAIYIFERIKGGEDAPLSLIDDIEKDELARYFFPGAKSVTEEQLTEILENKLAEFQLDLIKSSEFELSFYSELPKNEHTEPIRKITQLETLTELKLEIAKIGNFDIENMSIYEARRIKIINYRNLLKQRILELTNEDTEFEYIDQLEQIFENAYETAKNKE